MGAFLFFLLAITCVGAVLGMIISRNQAHNALFLVLAFACLGGLFGLLDAPFIAAVQIIIYAGAIMVLFLYVIMLLNPRKMEPVAEIVITRRGIAFLLAAVFFLLTAASVLPVPRAIARGFRFEAVGIKTLATDLLTEYLLPFELTSVLLLVAIVGAVLIAKRN